MRILFISNQRPHPPTAGGRQRTHLLIQALRRYGQVDLFLLDDPKRITAEDRTLLQREFNLVGAARLRGIGEHGIWRILRPLRPGIVDRIARDVVGYDSSYEPQPGVAEELLRVAQAGKYDVVVSRYLLPTVQSGAFGLGLPVVVDIDDLEIQICRERLAAPGLSVARRFLLSRALPHLETDVPKWTSMATHLWFSCPLDLGAIQHQSASVLPNVPFFKGLDRLELEAGSPQIHPQSVLVVGHLGWPSNVRGICWFINSVWPLIRQAGLPVEFRIVGAGLRPRLAARWRRVAGVNVVGFVDDLKTEYRNASVVVAPVVDGGGTKIKVLESLQYQRATIVTPQALRGYEHVIKDGEAVFVAGDAAQFAERVLQLLRDRGLSRRVGYAGAAIVDSQFSRDTFAAEVHKTMEKLDLVSSSSLRSTG
jgi:glycosyltransferase involved in cell wall biosynthesis